jgi:WD40 repeat protein
LSFVKKDIFGNEPVFQFRKVNYVNIQYLFSRDTMLKVWDTNTGEEIRSMGGHTGGITSVLLVKKDSQGIVVHNYAVCKHLEIMDFNFNLTFIPDEQSDGGGYIGVTGSHDCSIRVWSLADGK